MISDTGVCTVRYSRVVDTATGRTTYTPIAPADEIAALIGPVDRAATTVEIAWATAAHPPAEPEPDLTP